MDRFSADREGLGGGGRMAAATATARWPVVAGSKCETGVPFPPQLIFLWGASRRDVRKLFELSYPTSLCPTLIYCFSASFVYLFTLLPPLRSSYMGAFFLALKRALLQLQCSTDLDLYPCSFAQLFLEAEREMRTINHGTFRYIRRDGARGP